MFDSPLTILVWHQILFQGMFLIKTLGLRLKTGRPVRGRNKEAGQAILFFILFIAVALALAATNRPAIVSTRLTPFFQGAGLLLLALNLAISGASLIQMRDAWRVGIVEGQQTDLVTTGIYTATRNPYFVSYLLMFFAYTLICMSLVLFLLSLAGTFLVHRMILKEETFLTARHGERYLAYQRRVPRYLIF